MSRQTKINEAQLELMALRVHKKPLSEKMFVKEGEQENFSNVWSKAERDAKDSIVLREFVLQSDYEAKLGHVVYEHDLKMVEDQLLIQILSNELNAANNYKEEFCQRVAVAKIACV